MAKLLILLSIITNTFVFATTFIPVPIKRQIAESTGIVEGEVLNSEAIIDENGKIVTKIFIKADKWIGVQPTSGHLEVFFPGGIVGDRVQNVHGAPKFNFGEHVVLLLKNNNSKNWIQSLALGKFMVKKYGTTDIIINSVFPKHPKVGQMTLKSFYSLASRIKNRPFKERFKDKYELQVEKDNVNFSGKKRGRSIASVKSFETKQIENETSTKWILFLFGILGVLFTISRRKHSE
jgi:hypothetical protein